MKLRKNIALSDSGFLFNPSTGDSYSLNPMAARVLRWAGEGIEEDEIIKRILADFMADRDTVEKDLQDFSNMLHMHKLLAEE